MDTEKTVNLKRTLADLSVSPLPVVEFLPPAIKKPRKNQQYYEIFGDNVQLSISILRQELNKKRHRSLYPKDFHKLVLWLLGDEICRPLWIAVKHHPLCEKIIVIQIDSLNASFIQQLRKYHQSKQSSAMKTLGEFPFFQAKDYCPLLLDIPKFAKENQRKCAEYPSFKKLTVVDIKGVPGLKGIMNERYMQKNNNNASINKDIVNGKNMNKELIEDMDDHQKNGKCLDIRKPSTSLDILARFLDGTDDKSTLQECRKHSIFGKTYNYPPEYFIHSLRELKKHGYPCANKKYKHFSAFDNKSLIINNDDNNEDIDISVEYESNSESSVISSSQTKLASESLNSDSHLNNNSMVDNNDGIQRLVAIDCEMVVTANGQELARISIVSENGEILYDTLVKPKEPIIDYCTKFCIAYLY